MLPTLEELGIGFAKMGYRLKKLVEDDRRAVIDIFNHFVRNSFAAYPQAPVGYDIFDRFVAVTAGYPAVTGRDESGAVVGFGMLHPFHHADSFRHTAELTYFILPEHTGRGLGTIMLDHFAERAAEMGIHIFVASISSLNEQSLRFHRKHGFVECGRFRKVGCKNGTTFDVVWMQKFLSPDVPV